MYTSSGLYVLLYACGVCIFTPLTIFVPPPTLKREIALFLPFSEGSFSKYPLKSFTLRLRLPLSRHTSFQHDLWVASKDTRANQSSPFLVTCTNSFMEQDKIDFSYFGQLRTQASVKADNELNALRRGCQFMN